MTFTKALVAIAVVLGFHGVGLVFNLYFLLDGYDIFMHFAGGFAMGVLGLAIWSQGVLEVRFKKRLEKHLAFWIVPVFVIGFVSFVSIAWELHEYTLDQFFPPLAMLRQASIADTMLDFVMDLSGGLLAVLLFRMKKKS